MRESYVSIVKAAGLLVLLGVAATAWVNADLIHRMAMVGAACVGIGLNLTTPPGMSVLQWAKTLVGRGLMIGGVILLAVGIGLMFGLPALERAADRQVEKVKDAAQPDWLDKLPWSSGA